MYRDYFKSIFDFIVAFILLIVLFPVAFISAVALMITVGRPIFFRQIRLGKNGKEFGIIKFRTMKHKTDVLQTDADRLTAIGSFLRKTSIDEIPQLINIMKGEMSFIGPRPLLPEYMDYFTKAEKKRFEVKPGMSGYAEVMGRHQLSWDQQFVYDVEYVQKLTFLFDITIFLKTIPKVLNSSQVTGMGNAGKSRLDQVREKQN